MKGLKILILNWMDPKNPKTGGQEKYCHEMAKRLVRDGNQVTWVCSAFPGSLREEYIDGIRIIRTGNIYTVFIRSFFLYMKHRKSDIVFLSMNSILFFAPFHRKRVIMLHHRIELGVLRKKFRFIGVLAYFLQDYVTPFLYKNDKVFTVSNSSREDFLKLGYKHIDVVRLGVEVPPIQKFAKENLIVAPGPVKPWKHHDLVLKAFASLEKDWKLIVFGEYEDEEYKHALFDLATDLGIKDRVEFLGFVKSETLQDIYKKSSLCVVASEKEGWGLVAMEAQSYGCPVIGYSVPGIRESVMNGETGILVDYGDVEALTNSMKLMIKDTELRLRLSRMSIERSKDYSWDNCYIDFTKVISDVV